MRNASSLRTAPYRPNWYIERYKISGALAGKARDYIRDVLHSTEAERLPRLPRGIRWPVFFLGWVLAALGLLANPVPILDKGPLLPVGLFFGAAGLSLLGFLTYLVGLRTFLVGYERADVQFVFFPISVSAFLTVIVPIVVIPIAIVLLR